jgi:hypothetical protein
VTKKKRATAHAKNHFDTVQALAAKHGRVDDSLTKVVTQTRILTPAVAGGWTSAIDGSGRQYYYHTVTRETTWTHPGNDSKQTQSQNSGTWVTADAKMLRKLRKLKAKREALS